MEKEKQEHEAGEYYCLRFNEYMEKEKLGHEAGNIPFPNKII